MSKESGLAKSSDLMWVFRICKSKNRALRAQTVRALFLTFPHEKITFKWSKVVSETILQISAFYFETYEKADCTMKKNTIGDGGSTAL